MSLWRLAIQSLRYFWRTNLALLAGIAVGAAVLTGALLVGSSVRTSLRSITLQRLGRISDVLMAEQFFGVELAESLQRGGAAAEYTNIVPAVIVNQATIEREQEAGGRVQGITVVGAGPEFWELGDLGPGTLPGDDQIVINDTLAAELGAQVGDKLMLRLGKPSSLAADSPLARRDELLQTIVGLELVDIVPTRGLGRFSLQASQQLPATAFVNQQTLQAGLDQDGKVNALLAATASAEAPATESAFDALQQSLQPSLADLGLELQRVHISYQDDAGATQVVSQYDSLINNRMLFSPENIRGLAAAWTHEDPAVRELAGPQYQTVYSYLATKLQRLDSAGQPTGEVVAYSTVAAVDSNQSLGPVVVDEEALVLADDEIAINQWAADVLKVAVGDRIRLTYFEPETTHGQTVDRWADFRIAAVVPITAPDRPYSRRRDATFDKPPTLANDPNLTPAVKGITDAESIDKWDAPFEMDRSLLGRRDDEYWAEYRTTPKAFVSFATGTRLWHSRFGSITSYRFPAQQGESNQQRASALQQALRPHAADFGLHWLRVKQQGLAASQGTTPFDVLFLGFSQFLIVSALLLVSLLLRLALEQRASQLGLVAALGFSPRRRLRLLLCEFGILTLLGTIAGAVLGIGYAWLMLAGLRTWWVDAIATPFLQLTVSTPVLVLGACLGGAAALFTIYWTLRGLRNSSVAGLIQGQTASGRKSVASPRVAAAMKYAPGTLVVLALLMAAIAPQLPAEGQAGSFFGAGSCVLAAMLILLHRQLQNAGRGDSQVHSLTLPRLAYRNLARNVTRSTLTVGLVASACFLIVALSAFRLDPSNAGTGGFEWVGQSDQPIHGGWDEALSAKPDSGDTRIFPLRMQAGDDASCRNLYQASRPRLLGITEDFIQSADSVGGFEWAGTHAVDAGASAWTVLNSPNSTDDTAIPVVLDKNTAMYALHIYTGVGSEFTMDYGAAGRLRFRIVGLLSGSIFQGSLLVPESSLKQYFPRLGGYRYFLVDQPTPDAGAVAELEDYYTDQGLDLTNTRRLLTELLAVQNTYLSTFQSLGGLGLLLGTLGLAAVQLRNVMQRRGELALMRASGFTVGRLSRLVLLEHAMLLLGGLAVGCIAALIVVCPHLLLGGASIPFVSLACTLALVAAVGLATAWVAQRQISQTPLLPALRADSM